MNIIAEAKAYRTDGQLFETEKEAVDYNKFIEYKEAVTNLGEMNEPSAMFLISVANTLAKRKNARKMLDTLDEIDTRYENLEKDA